jgi:hypothetical protein
LLVVAKNVRHVDSAKVGLTGPAPIPNAFDNQSTYGDIKANVALPGSGNAQAAAAKEAGDTTNVTAGAAPGIDDKTLVETVTPDRTFDKGVAEDSFFTYQIVFVPDLAQKYGLRVRGDR